jgi:hypothetical protein
MVSPCIGILALIFALRYDFSENLTVYIAFPREAVSEACGVPVVDSIVFSAPDHKTPDTDLIISHFE